METSERKSIPQDVQQSTALNLTSKIKRSSEKKQATSKYQCPDPRCIYSTTNRSNLRRHVETMHNSFNSAKMCCNEYFFSKRHYHQHLKEVHSNGFKCKLCERHFKRRSILARHEDAIHGSLPHMHQCHHCSYSTSHKSNLKRHIQLKHKEISESETSIDSSKPAQKVKLWRPVPDIFRNSGKGRKSHKKIKRMGPVAVPVRTTSIDFSPKADTTFPPKGSNDESKTVHPAASFSSCSNKSLNSEKITDSCKEYLHKKIRWYARH